MVCSGRCCSVVACNTIQEEEEVPQAVQCAKCRHFHGDQLVGSDSPKETDKGSSPSLNLPGQVPESSPLPKPSQCRPSTPPSPHEGSPLLASRPVSPDPSERDYNLEAINDVQNEIDHTGKLDSNVPNDSVETRTDIGAESASTEDLDRHEAAKEEVFVVIEPSTTDCGAGISETSFIRKDIQSQIFKANQLQTLTDSSKSSTSKIEMSPRSPIKSRPKTPGGAQRVPLHSPKGDSDPHLPEDSDPLNAPESPLASSRLLSDTDDIEVESDREKPPFQKSLSVDSAKMSAVRARLDGTESPSESITALNLSPVKTRKKISVPFRVTPDGTKVNFLCDVSMYLCLPFLSVMSSVVIVIAGLTLTLGTVGSLRLSSQISSIYHHL